MKHHWYGRLSPVLAAAIVLLAASAAAIQTSTADDSLTLDPVTGDYRLRYLGDDDQQVEMTWVPPTKVRPTVWSHVDRLPSGAVRYRYVIAVEKGSPQPLSDFSFDAKQVIGTGTQQGSVSRPQGVPPGWDGQISPTFRSEGIMVRWNFSDINDQGTGGLHPGQKQAGFYIDSPDLPVVGIMRMFGSVPTQGFPDEGPGESEVGLKLREIEMGFVPRFAAIPGLSVPMPYDAAVVLSGIQAHIKADLVSMQLIDPTLATQLDFWFASAIDAAKRRNTSSLRHAIQELRRLLKQEQPDADKDDDRDEKNNDKQKMPKPRIDKLAAQVLDFDLRYVQKRSTGDKD